MKIWPQKPNMEDQLNRISAETSIDEKQLCFSRIDLDYTYEELELHEETSKHCVFALTGEKFIGHYRLRRTFYQLAEKPTVSEEKNERTLNWKTLAWLEDMIFATRGRKNQNTWPNEKRYPENSKTTATAHAGGKSESVMEKWCGSGTTYQKSEYDLK